MHEDSRELRERYFDLLAAEGIDIAGFLERTANGEFGTVSKLAVSQFLSRMEEIMVRNLETKLHEHPELASAEMDAVKRIQDEIDELRRRYLPRFP